ncbi:putative MORN repeat protein, partial [Babesia divergens]
DSVDGIIEGDVDPKISNDYDETWEYTDYESRMALYETEAHGPPLVGAAIIRYEDMSSHVEFSHPAGLQTLQDPGRVAKFPINNHNSWASADLDAGKQLEGSFHLVPRLALGAMLPTSLVDFIYFTLPTSCGNYLYGISYVARFDKENNSESNISGMRASAKVSDTISHSVPSHEEAETDAPGMLDVESYGVSRTAADKNKNAYFVAICVISKVPFFCYIGCKLEYIAQMYFHTKCFSDHQLLLSFVEQINSKECVENLSYESLYFNLELYFKPLALCFTYRALLFVIKCLMVGRKIIVYSECAARTTTAVLTFLTMIPGANALGFNCKGFGSMWHSWKKFGMPLHLFHSKNVLFPYFTTEMIGMLDDVNGYLIGITDRAIIKSLNNKADLIVNMEMNCVQLFNRNLLEMYHPSMYEINHFDTTMETFDDSEDDEFVKNVMDTGEAIYSSISGYLAKAPSTLISIGGSLKRYVNRRGNERGAIKCNESPLAMLDKYFPGSVPGWLKKCAISKESRPTVTKKKSMVDASSPKETPTPDEPSAFTIQEMFNKMKSGRCQYHYLGYLDNIQLYSDHKDRNREIDHAINIRINPMHNYLLKFLEDVAYVCGEKRLMYQLLMDFSLDFAALTDCSQRVMGVVLKRGDVYLRGDLPEEDGEPGFLDTLLNLDFDFDAQTSAGERVDEVSKASCRNAQTTKDYNGEITSEKKDDAAENEANACSGNYPAVDEDLNTTIESTSESASNTMLSHTMSPNAESSDGDGSISNTFNTMDNDNSELVPNSDGELSDGGDDHFDSESQDALGKREDNLGDIPFTQPPIYKTSMHDPPFDERGGESALQASEASLAMTNDVSSQMVAADESKEKPVEKRRSTTYKTRQPDDQEINFEVTGTLATRIMEIQSNHSMEFLERWLKCICAKKFFEEHNLNVFMEPIYLVNSSMAKHKYPNGDVYIGELVHLQREGKGTYIAADGTQYEGDWVGGKRHGHGSLISTKQGYKYTGEWANDKREGKGELTTPLFEYTGMFKDNQFNGRGKLVHKGGVTYEGDFENGMYNGRGRLIMLDGTIKMGSFRNNEIYGVCSIIKTDGRIYVGKLHGDVLNGKGRLIYNRLVSFEGQWNEGIRDGQGVVEIKLSEDGAGGLITIDGVWQNDSVCMTEVMITFHNGYKYVGSISSSPDLSQLMYMTYYDEALHGKAEEVMMACDNRILPHGQGIIKTPSGSSYSGQFFYGMRFGRGEMVFSNGVSYNGQWAFGTVHGEAEVTFPDDVEPRRVAFKYGKLIDKLEGSCLKYITECLEEVGAPGFEQEFTMRNLEPIPGLLTAIPETP